jgi:4-hydroxythreonine-4-phosphate dehydrogenase
MPISPEILIVADDLSGAADCAIACFAAGIGSFVALDGNHPVPEAGAIAIDTDSRRLDQEAAGAVTARMLRRHAGPQTRLIYKKMDSTCRGNFAAEIAASLAVVRTELSAPEAVAVLAPAYPQNGRTTKGGHQYLRDVPLEETETWRHDGIAGRAHLPEIMARTGLRVGLVELAMHGADLPATLREMSRRYDVLVCDAATEADLRSIAEAGQVLGPMTVWAGSAGLARYLPLAAGLARPIAPPAHQPPHSGPVICAVGSLSQISRGQFEMLRAAEGVAGFVVPPVLLRLGEGTEDWQKLSAAIAAAIAAGQDIAVLIGDSDHLDTSEALKLAAVLAALLQPFLAQARGIIATGGETARALLRTLDVAALQLAAEVEPGVPLSVVGNGPAAGLRVITKAGAFGAPETLLRCREHLKSSLFS